MNKQMKAATLKELEAWPDVTMTEEDGGKHGKIILHYKGETRLVVVSHTPSDGRAVQNHLSVLRREIRGLGAKRKQIVVGKPKKQPKAPANPVLREAPKSMEKLMTSQAKIEAIFKSIGELRYSEMLSLAEFMRDVATKENLRRGQPASWAKTLQAAVDLQVMDKQTRINGGEG